MTHRLLLPLAAILMLAAGCSHVGGKIELQSTDGSRTLTKTFDQAYITGKEGDYDIVLLDSATDWESKPGKGKAIRPVSLAPVRQVMRIHMYWRPMLGTTKNPAATNASIDWYVMGPQGSSDMLVYEGAGFIMADSSGRLRDVTIRTGQLRLKSSRGELVDPIREATLSGRATAQASEARVKDTIQDIKQQLPPTAP